jgi:tRNA A37 threonylcarbamoyladenosine synthetase subunit TsaC/SUA5/YrdC
VFELKNSKVVIADTDTVMGMLALDREIICKMKRRKQSQKIIRFIDNINKIHNLTDKEKDVLKKY